MKKILLAAVATASLILSVQADRPNENNKHQKKVSYPAVFWSEHSEKVFEEIHTDSSASTVISKVKGLADDSQATRLFIIRKQGMTTRELFRNARYMEYDRESLLNHSVAFTNFSLNGFDGQAESELATAFSFNATHYTLDDENEIPVLADALSQKINEKVAIIDIKESLPTALINTVSKDIQEAVKKASNTPYIMGIVGMRSQNAGANSTAFVSLQQVIAPKITQAKASNSGIQDYLYPNTLSGILIMLFIVLVMVIGFLQIMAVQTPVFLPPNVDKDGKEIKMDFGKIEQ